MSLLNEITIPHDITKEEKLFLDLVKVNMLRKLPDREKFVFLFIYELGGSQKDAALALDIHETNVSRLMRRIRNRLTPFKQGYVKN